MSQLKTYCQKLEDELIKHKKDLIEEQENLEHQKKLYAYLKSSSELEISQQKNSVLNQVQNRLEHELDKLERCFINPENLQANARIALKIIGTIKLSGAENSWESQDETMVIRANSIRKSNFSRLAIEAEAGGGLVLGKICKIGRDFCW